MPGTGRLARRGVGLQGDARRADECTGGSIAQSSAMAAHIGRFLETGPKGWSQNSGSAQLIATV